MFFKKKKNNRVKKFLDKKENYTNRKMIITCLIFIVLGFNLCLLLFIIINRNNDIRVYSGEFNKLVNTYYTIKDDYYGKKDDSKLIDSAINGMLSSLGDNYTDYTNKKETENFSETVSGVYEGIGCTVAKNLENNIEVIEVYKNSPAEKGGLKSHDVILKIDNKDFKGKQSDDMAEYIKTKKGSNIKLTVMRNNEEKILNINRSKIEIPSVFSKLLIENNKKVGYINIAIFSGVTSKQFKEQFNKMEKEGMESVIIDVRGNSGGYLTAVTDILNMFLKKGKVIYQLKDNKETKIIKDTTKEYKNIPVAILTDSGSASASEILAAAIKESYNGYVVGTNTFGKGTVQQTKTLPDGSMLKYTIQKWLTPKGNWINDIGVEPTNIVELDLNNIDENAIYDDQLQEALNILTK